MVMSVINGVTTYYASSSYVVEVDGSDTTVRKTYFAGSTSLAVRTIVNGSTETLNWLLSDHLGSSSITTAADGTWNSEIRYSAFGETRYSSGITPTDYRYTGQLEQKDVNLYYYNARYYDAALGRFIQADTIIPGAGDSKSYDRYAYVNNNPVRYTDPSGHCGPLTPICVWFAANAGVIIPTTLGLATLAFVGPSEPDMELMENPELSQERFEESLIVSTFFLTIGSTAAELETIYKAPTSANVGEVLDDITNTAGDGVVGGNANDIITTTEKELFSFGNKTSPKGGRPSDFGVENITDIIGPEYGPLPNGASAFDNVNNAPLSGHYHSLPSDTNLPEG